MATIVEPSSRRWLPCARDRVFIRFNLLTTQLEERIRAHSAALMMSCHWKFLRSCVLAQVSGALRRDTRLSPTPMNTTATASSVYSWSFHGNAKVSVYSCIRSTSILSFQMIASVIGPDDMWTNHVERIRGKKPFSTGHLIHCSHHKETSETSNYMLDVSARSMFQCTGLMQTLYCKL